MAKERIFNLPETKGSFQLRGIVSGVAKDSFYKESKTSNNNDKRSVNFGLEVEKGMKVYTGLQAFPRNEVYFYSSKEKKTDKVAWANRHNYNKEGYRLLGVNLGLTKIVGQDGSLQNDKKVMTEFDACRYIKENLKDESSVFVRGNLEFSSFEDKENNNLVKMTRLTPNQISLCSTVDFDQEDFKPTHTFQQKIVFMEIQQEIENEKPTGRFIVYAKIVTYSTIEDVAFILLNKPLAQNLRKLKPYTALEVWGDINTIMPVTQVEEDDGWGTPNPNQRVDAAPKREFVITGADKNSIDTEVYNRKAMEEAIVKIKNAKQAENDFADKQAHDDWGAPLESVSAADDEEEAW